MFILKLKGICLNHIVRTLDTPLKHDDDSHEYICVEWSVFIE